MKKGFTLSEVLITLGVIGVVAALTLPTLIKNYQKHVTVNKLKTAYSIFSQAVIYSIEENGDPSNWNVDKDTFLSIYINPYLKNPSEVKPYNIYTTRSLKDGKGIYTTLLFHTIQTKTFVLNNGMSYSFTLHPNWGNVPSYNIFVDINGAAEPNILGKDVFTFIVTLDKGLRMAGYTGTIQGLMNECNKNGSGYYSGINCGAIIEKSGWKIPEDYPW